MTTDTFPITANADDGYRYSTTTFAITATIIGNNGSAGNNYSAFFRFTNITIPQGATISAAKLLFVCLGASSGAGCNTRITGEHANNPAAVTSQADWDGRVKTTEFVDWDGIPTWVASLPYESPDIANVIQDIIEEAWWDSGDAIQIFWEEHGAVVASGNYRYPADYSHATYTEARLEITWTLPIPVVTTQAADNISVGAGTLHGTITATGGENCSERGFDYDYDSGAPYANEWTETNSYGTGAFEKVLTRLKHESIVYFRAKAQNSVGWGYGSEKSFKVPAVIIQYTVIFGE